MDKILKKKTNGHIQTLKKEKKKEVKGYSSINIQPMPHTIEATMWISRVGVIRLLVYVRVSTARIKTQQIKSIRYCRTLSLLLLHLTSTFCSRRIRLTLILRRRSRQHRLRNSRRGRPRRRTFINPKLNLHPLIRCSGPHTRPRKHCIVY